MIQYMEVSGRDNACLLITDIFLRSKSVCGHIPQCEPPLLHPGPPAAAEQPREAVPNRPAAEVLHIIDKVAVLELLPEKKITYFIENWRNMM